MKSRLTFSMERLDRRLQWFSFASGFYQASRMLCSGISQLYLLSLGFNLELLFTLHAFHSLVFGLLNVPIAAYADAFGRKKVVFFGLTSVSGYFLSYCLLPYLPHATSAGSSSAALWLIFLSEIFYGLGRQSVTLALNGWIVEEIPPQHRAQKFSLYAHRTQNYSTILSIVSGTIGILLAYKGGYFATYLLSFFSMLVTLISFAWIACQPAEPWAHEEASPGRVAQAQQGQDGISLFQTLQGTLSHAVAAWRSLQSAPLGLYAFSITIFVALSRWIVYHFWQPLLLGNSVQVHSKISLDLVLKLLLCNFGMYFAQFLTNRSLRKYKVFNQRYLRSIQRIMLLGVVSALYLAFSNQPWLRNRLSDPIAFSALILSFSVVQGSVGSMQVMQDNVYVKSCDAKLLSSCVSNLQLISRIFVSICSFLLTIMHFKGREANFHFIIPVFSIIGFQVTLSLLQRRLKSSEQREMAEPAASETRRKVRIDH